MMMAGIGKFSRTLLEIERESRAAGTPLSRTALAEKAKVSKSAVTAWFGGDQLPRPDKLSFVAKAYASGNALLEDELHDRLSHALLETQQTSALRSPMERVRTKALPIKIEVFNYGPIGVFLKSIISTFLDYAALKVTQKERTNLLDITMGEDGSDADIVAGILATPDRAQNFRFIRLPLMMGVNAITFGSGAEYIKSWKEDTARKSVSSGLGAIPPLIKSILRPIAHRGEVGYLYAQHMLKFAEHEIIDCEYEADAYAARLEREFQRWREHTPDQRERLGLRLPVVVVDELMILKVYQKLLGRLAMRRSEPIDESELPVLLMGDKAGDAKIGFRPYYNIPLCIPRLYDSDDKEWYEFVSDIWSIFARSNYDYLQVEYARLWQSLREPLENMRRTFATMPVRKGLGDREVSSWLERVERWIGFSALDHRDLPEPRQESQAKAKDASADGEGGAEKDEARRPTPKVDKDRFGVLEYPWNRILVKMQDPIYDARDFFKVPDEQTIGDAS